MDMKSQAVATCLALMAVAGTSTITPPLGSPCPRTCSAKAAASALVETIGAITHTSAWLFWAAWATAVSCSSSSSGCRREVRSPRTPRAGLGSSGTVTNSSGLSAPASRVRTTTLRPAKASKTRW
jgi:hypothetical protein